MWGNVKGKLLESLRLALGPGQGWADAPRANVWDRVCRHGTMIHTAITVKSSMVDRSNCDQSDLNRRVRLRVAYAG